MKHPLLAVALVIALGMAALAEARVISYAPYTDRTSVVTFHHRMTRHFLITELTNPSYTGASLWQVVLYDSMAAEEPRVLFETKFRIYWAAMWEDERHVPVILIAYYKENTPYNSVTVMFSNDGGRNFMDTALPASTYGGVTQNYVDNGGPFTRGRFAPVRIGNKDFPFVVYDSAGAVWRVAANGVATNWTTAEKNSPNALLGSNAEGTKFLIRRSSNYFELVGFDGTRMLDVLPWRTSYFSGWITPDSRIYMETSSMSYANGYYDMPQPSHMLFTFDGTKPQTEAPPRLELANGFAIPTHDYSGAWIIDRKTGGPTHLLRHTREKGFEEVWSDPAGPEIEALHAGASGKTLLVQVHRPRPQPDRIITDPALAVWRVGNPAPTDYDELFLAEQVNKGFVHVDPDLVGGGEPFVFDSGIYMYTPPTMVISAWTPGSADPLQEWGVVRASLRQTLVIPGVGRAIGAYGSNWTTDVTLYNPAAIPQKVELRFAQSGGSTSTASHTADTKTVTLNAREIRILPDILGTLFGRIGSGALFLQPELGINATSRTYTRSATGTYGFGMNAIDIYASASPRFPVSFAGAFTGPTFRTNVTLADTAGGGSEATFLANAAPGFIGRRDLTFAVPAAGQQQVNNVETHLGIPWTDGGALLIRPKRGFVVASVFAIDNITNDPTWFPPDINSSIPRWIPVIGHLDGAYGSQFRTDIHLYNPESSPRFVYLSAIPWNTFETARTETIQLQANEARVIRDAYATLFKKSGLARLRYTTSNPTSGIRVTSRTYTLGPNGGTYGCLTPPLNGFQLAARGESLELLGVTGGAGYRTNLGIVEMNLSPANNQPPGSARIEIIDERGTTIDDFTVSVPIAGGFQINDIFRTRGHGHGPAAALIRVSPIRGQITTYATVTDNGTNDSIYLAPYLAAQQ